MRRRISVLGDGPLPGIVLLRSWVSDVFVPDGRGKRTGGASLELQSPSGMPEIEPPALPESGELRARQLFEDESLPEVPDPELPNESDDGKPLRPLGPSRYTVEPEEDPALSNPLEPVDRPETEPLELGEPLGAPLLGAPLERPLVLLS